MGRNSEFVCKTCRKAYGLGYSSNRSWLDHIKNIKEYDELNDERKELQININFEQCLKNHDGHDYFTHSSDWTSTEGKDLLIDDPFRPYVLCEDYTEFNKTNMDI